MADANQANQANPRVTREQETRDTATRKKAWTPPTTLPMPTPQEGWVFRWIRTSLMGQPDAMNVSASRREHWEPVKAVDHPELMLYADPRSPYKDFVEVGGLLLCKAPKEVAEQRREFYKQAGRQQMEAVNNNYMQAQTDVRMPVFNENRKTKVTFGDGG